MINNNYKKIIRFIFKYKTKIILIFFVPQLFVASYNFFNIERGCILFADYKISNIILDKSSVDELYLQLLYNEMPNLKTVGNQFVIENINSDVCKKELNYIIKLTEEFSQSLKDYILDNKFNNNFMDKTVTPLLFFDNSTYNNVSMIKVEIIKETNSQAFKNSKLIFVTFLFSIILNILFFLKKNIKLSKYF